MSDVWKSCRKGSCRRHQACMYVACLSVKTEINSPSDPLDAASGASGMKPKGKALTDVDKDVEFWESLMPPGFRLNGWTYRSSATLLTPTNRTWQVTAELLRQIRSAFNV
jgi:hypothetical protein